MSTGPLRARSYTPSVDVGMKCVEAILDGEMACAEVACRIRVLRMVGGRPIAPLSVRWEEWLRVNERAVYWLCG